MPWNSKLPFYRQVALLGALLVAGIGGTLLTIGVVTDRLLYEDAVMVGNRWTEHLTENVADLAQIASSADPSAESRDFFRRTQQFGRVFRYKIFDSAGRLRLISDDIGVDAEHRRGLTEHNPTAAMAVASGGTYVKIGREQRPGRAPHYAEVYVPIVVKGQTAGFLEVYVDQSKLQVLYQRQFVIVAVVLCLLLGISFGIPAFAWYRRSREKQAADARIRFLARYDPLTGTVNRAGLIESLTQFAADATRGGTGIALFSIEIDRFGSINDAYGHRRGDLVLQAAAERLGGIAGSHLVARTGGDEFTVVQTNVTGAAAATELARRIVEGLAVPFVIDGHRIAITASVGVALAPDNGTDAGQLMECAATAVHKCKFASGNAFCFFSAEMNTQVQDRFRLESLLREALPENRFELHYQPILQVADSQIVGFEALLRLKGPDGNYIPPGAFIPVAEETGLINTIGAWVLREACRTAAGWRRDLMVAVNLSPSQFMQGGLADFVGEVLRETGLDPRRLELEITETLLMTDHETVMQQLRHLKAIGVSIAMDDFGTGYSSLSYLWRFPFDKLKIDRAFMWALHAGDREVGTVLRTIVALARELAMRVTVEGVETAEQAAFVREIECDEVQGFYFAHPLTAGQIGNALAIGRRGADGMRAMEREAQVIPLGKRAAS